MSAVSKPTPEAAIEAGRAHYKAKKYKSALEQFTRAMKGCSCTRGMKRERCTCKNFEEVAAKDGSIFKEAMYNCKCSVGRTFNKCDSAVHIQALDYRAATFEALQELDRARRDAEWILELAPRLADGYLRLGKIARLQKKHEFAWKVYNSGVEVVVANGSPNPQKLEQLYKAREPLQLRFNKKDPLDLPVEIIHMIFSLVDDLASLVRCLRVSKTWRAALTSRGNERLWRSLNFTGPSLPRKPPRTDSLIKILAASNKNVHQITIKDAKRFCLSQTKFLMLMNASPNLERLDIAKPFEAIDSHVIKPNMKVLSLSGFDEFDRLNQLGHNKFFHLTCRMAQNLVDLTLFGYPMEWADAAIAIPAMNRLKFLKLGKGASRSILTSIMKILEAAPNLEQICLDKATLHDALAPGEEPRSFAAGLRVVRIINDEPRGPFLMDSTESGHLLGAYQFLLTINRAMTLEYLDISYRWHYNEREPHTFEMLSGYQAIAGHQGLGEPGFHYAYANVHTLRLQNMSLSPEKAAQLFEGPLRKGTLDTFDIVFPLEPLNGQDGRLSKEHLAGYSWLEGATCIRNMALLDFSFSSMYTDETKMPLIKFLASFPNLEILEIDSQSYEEGDMFVLIRDVLKMTHLKMLYQSKVKGALMDQLKALAKTQGVELVWGERPREWPVRLPK